MVCINLKYSLKYFPKCKQVIIYKTCFDALYDIICNDTFIKLIDAKTNFEYESILMIAYLSEELEFEEYIKPLLKNETMTEEAFKHKYRGIKAGERYVF